MKHLILTFTASLIYSISFGGVFGGDVLTTKDGQVIEGKISKIKNCEVVLFTNEYKYIVTASNLSSIQFEAFKGKAYRQYMALDSDSEFKLQMAAEEAGQTWISDLPLIAKIGIYCGAALTGFYIGWNLF
jgi:hypothetical protein